MKSSKFRVCITELILTVSQQRKLSESFFPRLDAKISTFKTSVLSVEQIVDTNGAGDAFVGGN